MVMKKYKKDKLLLINLFLIIFFQLNCFYLLDETNFPIKFSDIALLFEIAFFVLTYFWQNKRNTYNKYLVLFLLPLILACTSSLMAFIRYQQPFFMGFRAQRSWIAAMLMFFPLTKAISDNRMSIKEILKMIDGINIIYFAILFLQYILGDWVQFLHLIMNERYGSIRLYASTSFIVISYAYHFCLFFRMKKINLSNLFFICSTIFVFLFITKSRMGMIALFLSSIIIVLKQKMTIKKVFIIAFCFFAIALFLSSSPGQEILGLIFKNNIVDNDTSGIRQIGREFYMSELVSSSSTFIFGCGYINIDWPQTVIAVRYEEGIFIVDNGIFGNLYIYGFISLLWMVVVYFIFFKKAICLNNDFILCSLLIGVLGLYSLVPDIFSGEISFVLQCAILYSLQNQEITKSKSLYVKDNSLNLNKMMVVAK